jgi:AAT family amino acid transporter
MPLWFIALALVWRFRVKNSLAREDYVYYQPDQQAE